MCEVRGQFRPQWYKSQRTLAEEAYGTGWCSLEEADNFYHLVRGTCRTKLQIVATGSGLVSHTLLNGLSLTVAMKELLVSHAPFSLSGYSDSATVSTGLQLD